MMPVSQKASWKASMLACCMTCAAFAMLPVVLILQRPKKNMAQSVTIP
jgi:hypothetical protein